MGSAGNKLSGFRRLPTLNKKPLALFAKPFREKCMELRKINES